MALSQNDFLPQCSANIFFEILFITTSLLLVEILAVPSPAPPPGWPTHAVESPSRHKSSHSDPAECSPVHQRLQQDSETASYLRTTESVVTAMQARVTAEEQEALGAQLRARLRALEQKTPQPSPLPPQQARRLPVTTARQQIQRGESDSSSEAGDCKPRSRADSAGPHTRYNRAFRYAGSLFCMCVSAWHVLTGTAIHFLSVFIRSVII